MSTNTTEEIQTPKKKFFDCKSITYIVLFMTVGMLSVSGYAQESIVVGLIAFIVLLVCAWKNIAQKEYGMLKKVGVFIGEFIIALVIVILAVTFAQKNAKSTLGKSQVLSCNAPEVQASLEQMTRNYFVQKRAMTEEDAKNLNLVISNVLEQSKEENLTTMMLSCKADLLIENFYNSSLDLVMNYKLVLDKKSKQLKTNLYFDVKQ